MKLNSILTGIFILFSSLSHSQNFSADVRGIIIDGETKNSISNATIIVTDSLSPKKTLSDESGNFILRNCPVGKISINVSYVGYKEVFINNVEVNTGKSTYLRILLETDKKELEPVVVQAKKINKATTINRMGLVSSRVFSKVETEKYAGSLGDPARMVQNFAGVANAGDSRNDIVIRGNSPYGLLWNIDGITVTNPNHFGAKGSTGGPITILNSNLLTNSDFFSGNFPAQYGNAFSGVFDLNLRTGNKENSERTLQFGWNGLELGLEGPFKKGGKSSYVAAYRYSTLQIFDKLGINLGLNGVPTYQDLTVKVDIPTAKFGKFDFVLISGLSSISITRGEIGQNSYEALWDIKSENNKLIAYLKNHYQINNHSSLSSYLAYSFDQNKIVLDSPKIDKSRYLFTRFNESDNNITGGFIYSNRFNTRNFFESGYKLIKNGINYNDSTMLKEIAGVPSYFRFAYEKRSNIYQSQFYTQLRHSLTAKTTLYSGLHFNFLHLNNTYSFEPRFSIKTKIGEKNEIGFGYSLVSKAQPFIIYFNIDSVTNIKNNINLGFTKAHQSAFTWDYYVSQNFRIKTELYYQLLFNVPVQKTPSWYSMLNFGAEYYQDRPARLVNNGKGKNYGLELTLEKFFSKNWYFLSTLSVFKSTYLASDNLWRKSQFDRVYVYNLLGGYEFKFKNNYSLEVNDKLTFAGGTPLKEYKTDGLINKETVFTNRSANYFRTDIRIGLKKINRKATHQVAIDLQNATNKRNEYIRNYNQRTQQEEISYQMGFLPILSYRLTF